MDDFLEAARNGASGTVANFNGWSGINKGGFKPMKITSSETIIEPNEGIKENETIIEHDEATETSSDEVIEDDGRVEQDLKDRPGMRQAYLNPTELKNIAIKLMPTVDKLMHNIYEPLDKDAMRNVSETAINMAFEFLQVWNEKVSVE